MSRNAAQPENALSSRFLRFLGKDTVSNAEQSFKPANSVRLSGKVTLRRALNANALTEVLDQILAFEVAWFEAELAVWKENPQHKLRAFPQSQHELISKDELPDEIYMEGAQKTILQSKCGRNPKARARCIAVHREACKVCGFAFAIAFGAEFSGKIHVHHIKPISEIGEEYVVDPVKDLVPVCPNCHMMLHSKADGVYSVEELKQLRMKQM